MSRLNKNLEGEQVREKELELLDSLEPELVKNLDPIYQRLLAIWREAKSRQDAHKGSGRAEP